MSSQSVDAFFRACEVAAPPELRLGHGAGVVRLTQPFAVIGRDPRCDVVVDDASVGRRHSYLQAIGSRLLCIDFKQGEAVKAVTPRHARAYWVEPEGKVAVGNHWVRLGGGSRRSSQDERVLESPLPRIALEFQADQLRTRWRMRKAVALVGSGPDCTIRLHGSSVSRYHCALVLTGTGLWVVDLLGELESATTKGVSVNNVRVRFARLDPGDVLRLGQFLVNVRTLSPSSKANDADAEARADEPESGEIELSGRSRILAPQNPALDALRGDYDARIHELQDRHFTEVGRLRQEIAELRDWVDELRSRARPSRDVVAGTVRGPAPRPAAALIRDHSVPTLGIAKRGSKPAHPLASPARFAPVLTDAELSRPDLATIITSTETAWSDLDGGLAASPHQDARPLS